MLHLLGSMDDLTLSHHNESTVADICCVNGAIFSVQYKHTSCTTAYEWELVEKKREGKSMLVLRMNDIHKLYINRKQSDSWENPLKNHFCHVIYRLLLVIIGMNWLNWFRVGAPCHLFN